jgi:hypothetical protein
MAFLGVMVALRGERVPLFGRRGSERRLDPDGARFASQRDYFDARRVTSPLAVKLKQRRSQAAAPRTSTRAFPPPNLPFEGVAERVHRDGVGEQSKGVVSKKTPVSTARFANS